MNKRDLDGWVFMRPNFKTWNDQIINIMWQIQYICNAETTNVDPF